MKTRPAVDDARKSDLAEIVVRRIVENAIRVSCARWSIVESLDEDADITEDDLVEDALAVALGEDTGCLGDDEMNAEHIDVLFVRSKIAELEAQLSWHTSEKRGLQWK